MGPECMGHLTDVCDCELNLSAAEMKLATGTYTSGLGTQRLESKTILSGARKPVSGGVLAAA